MLFVVMNHTHGKSAPWPWYQIITFLWCYSQHLADCWQTEGFLYTNVAAIFLSDPQGIGGSPRDQLKHWMPLDHGQRNPTKGQRSEHKMEGTETQYYTGGRIGGQGSWKVSDARLKCIIVSLHLDFPKKLTETLFNRQFPFRKDH